MAREDEYYLFLVLLLMIEILIYPFNLRKHLNFILRKIIVKILRNLKNKNIIKVLFSFLIWSHKRTQYISKNP